MGTPRVELLRDTIRHACGVTHVVSLTRPTATFHPRPIAGSGFYANACFFRSIPSQVKGLGVRSFSTNNEQRFTNNEQLFKPCRGVTFVTPWLLALCSDARYGIPKRKCETLHRNRKAWLRAFYTFFLVLIQERTKENQG